MKNKLNLKKILYFKENTVVYTSDDNWIYNTNIQRLIYSDEPLLYVKYVKKHKILYHYFTSLGLKYVFCGPMTAFKN